MKQNWKAQWSRLLKGLDPAVLDTLDEVLTWIEGVLAWADHLDDQVPDDEYPEFKRFIKFLRRVPPTWMATRDLPRWREDVIKWRRDITPLATTAFKVLDRESVNKTYREDIGGQIVEWIEPLDPESIEPVRVAIRRLNKAWPLRPKMMLRVKNSPGDVAGRYNNGVVHLFPSSMMGGSGAADSVFGVLVHEWGHLLWQGLLNNEAQDAWEALWRSRILIPVREIYTKLNGDWGNLIRLIDQDPYLFVQIMSLEEDTGQTAEEVLEAAQNAHKVSIQVPPFPISQYGNTSPIEAFCDALGNVVREGRRAVPAPIYQLLKIMINRADVGLKLARKRKTLQG